MVTLREDTPVPSTNQTKAGLNYTLMSVPTYSSSLGGGDRRAATRSKYLTALSFVPCVFPVPVPIPVRCEYVESGPRVRGSRRCMLSIFLFFFCS